MEEYLIDEMIEAALFSDIDTDVKVCIEKHLLKLEELLGGE